MVFVPRGSWVDQGQMRRGVISSRLASAGFHVFDLTAGEAARRRLADFWARLVRANSRFCSIEGFEILAETSGPAALVVLSHGPIERAIAACGTQPAFLARPLTESNLSHVLHRVLDRIGQPRGNLDQDILVVVGPGERFLLDTRFQFPVEQAGAN